MNKKLYCIRHGEATHNVLFKKLGMSTFFDKNQYDTELTELGSNQARELGSNWADKHSMDVVIVSPLTRTLQTASYIFNNCNIKIIALDCTKEYPQGLHTCNKRQNKSNLVNKFKNVDFNQLDSEEDEMWSDTKLETTDELKIRVNKLYQFIKQNQYKNICLVGHNSQISMVKDQRLNRNEDGLEELRHCHPQIVDIKFNQFD